jgi:L-gulono-1,4-lactone dehydrogenase
MRTVSRNVWTNWAANQRCAPAAVERPSSEADIVRIVRDAANAGRRVKVVGAGHSFTAIALTDGHLLTLDDYARVISHDAEKRTVTVQAGIRLQRLNEELHARGLAMPNLGDIAYQSIAGAISTATHGTGATLGGIATQVIGMRIVAGDGSITECSESQNAEVFHAARVGLGALGIVSTVTLQCVPAFNLRAVESPTRVDELLSNLDEHVNNNDHFEFFWVPHTGWALTKWNNRTEDAEAPRGRWHAFRDDILMSNAAFGVLCRVGRLRPSLIPRLSRMIPSSGRVEYVDRSYRVFSSPRLVKFYEMEYAIPAEACAEALNRVRKFVDESGLMISFPVEVRFTAADDIPLSTAHGRKNCYIAVHVYQGTQYQQYFEAVEDIMDDYGGRPHWGKLHFQTSETLAPRYPEWDRFQAVRNQLDPDRRFTNAYLDRVLGT